MLYKETVEQGTLDLIHRLMEDQQLKQFNLVGGTALALMIGHRISIDIDLFTKTEFNVERIAEHLSGNYLAEVYKTGKNSITGFMEGVKFDLITHEYPQIAPTVNIEGIRMLGLHDIAAMKINAIVGDGTRVKDFLDVYYLLKEMPYGEMLGSYLQKYPNTDAERARQSLLYYDDIDFTTKVTMLKDRLKWKDIRLGIKDAISEFYQYNQGYRKGRRL